MIGRRLGCGGPVYIALDKAERKSSLIIQMKRCRARKNIKKKGTPTQGQEEPSSNTGRGTGSEDVATSWPLSDLIHNTIKKKDDNLYASLIEKSEVPFQYSALLQLCLPVN